MKRIMSILLTIVIASTFFYANPVSASTEPKMIFLYAGKSLTKTYPIYTISDINALTGVTDFVISYGMNSSNYTGDQDFINATVALVNTIISAKPNAKIWVSTPPRDMYNYPTNSTTELNALTTFLTNMQSAIGSTKWANNIVGVYYNGESIYGTVNYSDLLSNPQISSLNSFAYRVKNWSSFGYKKFMWAPYYGYGVSAAEVIKKIGYVTNQTSIFDYVFIQPHYYFTGTDESNLDGVYYSMVNQKVCYRDGVQTCSRLSSATAKIGVTMEIDGKYNYGDGTLSYQTYRDRYAKYTAKFDSIKSGYPVCFYAGGEIELMDRLYNNVNSFYSY